MAMSIAKHLRGIAYLSSVAAVSSGIFWHILGRSRSKLRWNPLERAKRRAADFALRQFREASQTVRQSARSLTETSLKSLPPSYVMLFAEFGGDGGLRFSSRKKAQSPR